MCATRSTIERAKYGVRHLSAYGRLDEAVECAYDLLVSEGVPAGPLMSDLRQVIQEYLRADPLAIAYLRDACDKMYPAQWDLLPDAADAAGRTDQRIVILHVAHVIVALSLLD